MRTQINSACCNIPSPKLPTNSYSMFYQNANHNSDSSKIQCSCKLGVNQRTGRIQWCPGFTCCNFFIILPVVMLPITLVLVLLMRLDGMMLALRIQQRQRQNIYEDGNSFSDGNDNQQLLSDKISDEDRISRCISMKLGVVAESIDIEDRDIMKDSRTSFLPRDTTTIPIECLKKDYKGKNNDARYWRRKRRSNYNYYWTFNKTAKNRNEQQETASEDEKIVAGPILKAPELQQDTTGFNFIWHSQDSKHVIRAVQAKTMLKYMDDSIDPCNDFYRYACGNWEKLNAIPKDKAGFDTFEMLRENLDGVLKELLEENNKKEKQANSNIVPIINNHFYQKATIAQSQTITSAVFGMAVNEDDTGSFVEAARLRKHIIHRREALKRIISRYRRQEKSSISRKQHVQIENMQRESFSNFANPEDKLSAEFKAKQLYQSCIDSALLEQRGISPLLDLIDSLGGWPVLDPLWSGENFDWLNLTAHLRLYNNDIFIVQWVGPDIKNSDENVIQFDQTSLGLPTREYFLQDSNAKFLNAYEKFMAEVMQKLGVALQDAELAASELISFETNLASITSPAEQRLNVTKLYKRMTLRDLQRTIPNIDWGRYLTILQNRKISDSESVVIYATQYMHDLVSLLADTEPRVVANYLIWRFIRHRINNVDDRFEDIKQNFYHSLFGREESPLRWKVCISQVNTNMGMALGAMFVRKYFDENSKKDTLEMTYELQQAFRDILKSTDWIDTPTRNLAERKVNAMSLKIGYPDFILSSDQLNEKYAGIEIKPDKYFENTLNVLRHTAQIEQNKLNEAVNRTAWQTAPAIVNAYYSRNKNQIMFPAGILQPPFYHRHFPRALNFGGIGVVIGHELTHGFDDKGRLFDQNGSIHKWWSDTSIKSFDDRARCLISQYGNYTVDEVGIALNGESTQGENIADNGGIRQAFHAYQKWLQNNPDARYTEERLPGLNMTGEQLFFLNFGQVWCGAMRPEAVRNKLNTAIHSPGRFRVIGTLSNSYDFSREFQCPLGSPMNPVHKCSVW